MCKLLMSINPQHVNNILAGTKRFEYRKTKCIVKDSGNPGAFHCNVLFSRV